MPELDQGALEKLIRIANDTNQRIAQLEKVVNDLPPAVGQLKKRFDAIDTSLSNLDAYVGEINGKIADLAPKGRLEFAIGILEELNKRPGH